jgi:RHS repeat-associated protein
MPKNTATFDLASYTPVAARIRLFYERYPAGRILTELVSREVEHYATVITFRALAFRSAADTEPAASGWASERDDDGEINSVACLENAEHIYDLRFTYDIGGRRDTLVHPPQFGGRTIYSYDPRTGQLETVTDKAGNRFRHHYDVMGRLDSLVRLDGRAGKSVETFVYDLRSRIANRAIVADSAQVGINDTLFYDRRDKVLVKHGGATDTTAYDAFGHVVYADLNGASSNSQYTLDAMGHRSYGREDHGHLNITETDYQFEPGTERVTREASSLPHSSTQGDTTWTSYDEFGNLYYSLRQKVLDPTITIEWTINNTYDSFNRLASHMMMYDSLGTNRENRYTSGESYRYDALGRRVWYQAVRDTSCSVVSGTCYRNCVVYEPATACISPITRVVWDGDQILYEIRADGGVHADTFAKENDTPTGALYGQVAYSHGLGMDTPLSVIKGSSQIIPITNWRGQITQGTCPVQACSSSQVRFPQRGLYGAANFVNTPPPNWYGSLIEGQRDGSGYIYQRNRYLDPTTGRFTQEDPIGLTGGGNLYGFANGDPITYSDPFGLCTPQWVCDAYNAAIQNGKQFIAVTKANIALHGGGFSGFNAIIREGLQPGSPARNLLMAGTIATAEAVGPVGATESPAEIVMPGGSPIGTPGSRGVRELTGNAGDAKAMFTRLTRGAKPIQTTTYPGSLMQLPNGGTVGLRTVMSRSPNTAATIDIRGVDGVPDMKIKFNP